MKQLISALVALSLSACEGSSTTNEEMLVGPACQVATDCPCPTGYEPSCKDATCLCLRTEVIPSDAGPSDAGPAGCQSPEDCNCGSGMSNPYNATCTDGMCYCEEKNKECYLLKRGEFIFELMNKMVYLGDYVPPEQYYSDVPPDYPYYLAIEAATELGIIKGYADADGGSMGTFGPEDNLNRAEGAKVIITAINGLSGLPQPFTPHYLDVPSDAWFFVYVEAATVLNLTHGYVNQDGTPTGYYGPADVASSCFMNGMMAHANIPHISFPYEITIAIEQINDTNPIVIEGETELLSVRYKVFGTSAQNPLNDIRVINQPDGEGTAPQSTLGTEDVFISCAPPSGIGTYTVYASTPVNGVAQFNSLNCYDETGNGLEVQLGYNVAHFSVVGDILSGQVFRIVLDDDRLQDIQASVPLHTVRKTLLTFANTPSNSSLSNGMGKTLFPFQVKAHPNGAGELARLVFMADKYDANGNGSLKLSGFKLSDGIDLIVANIFDQNGQDISDSGVLETSKFIVTFPNGVDIPAGTTKIFQLKATASGVEQGDSFTTRIDFGDDDLMVTGKTGETTPNTARLISSIDTVGLFPNLAYWLFSTPEDRNVIWSDRSADAHHYSIEDSASSYDFTNGYKLSVSQLNAVTITAN